ncbi:MAG: DUF1007 family protein [bacterium]
MNWMTARWIILIFISLLPQIIQAGGFSYQIDIKTKLIINEKKTLTHLLMTWTYDRATSTLLLDGGDLSTPALKKFSLTAIADEIMHDLAKKHYFTELRFDQRAVYFAKASHYKLELLADQRLQLRFKLPLKSQYQLKGRHYLQFRHYDPKGTAILYYPKSTKLHIPLRFVQYCKKHIQPLRKTKFGQVQQAILRCRVP